MAMGPGSAPSSCCCGRPPSGMTSLVAFTVLVGLVGLERVAELVVSTRNAALEQGAGRRRDRPRALPVHGRAPHRVAGRGARRGLDAPRPTSPAPWPGRCCSSSLLTQALRWWCIGTLGRRWNTRVIVVPGSRPSPAGPYRLLRHPNYVAVVVEGIALPLVHAAWITALVFTVLNAGLLDGAHPGGGRRARHPAPPTAAIRAVIDLSWPVAVRSAWPRRSTPPAPASRSSSRAPTGPGRQGLRRGTDARRRGGPRRARRRPRRPPIAGIAYSTAGAGPRPVPPRRRPRRPPHRSALRAARRGRHGRGQDRVPPGREGREPEDTCSSTGSPRRTSSPPTACTRRSGAGSASSCRPAGTAGSACAATSRCRRGRRTSRCTGPAARRRT